jgi:hypothetical protein
MANDENSWCWHFIFNTVLEHGGDAERSEEKWGPKINDKNFKFYQSIKPRFQRLRKFLEGYTSLLKRAPARAKRRN